MRHGKKINSLGRKSAHRKAMLSNMACSLIEHKRINTTVAKAKALRTYLEPLITKSKTDNTHSRRIVFGYLQNKTAVSELFREISPKIAERPGGYLRIIRLGNRAGDNAEMCMIELVDFNEVMTKGEETKKTRRSRRGKGTSKAVDATDDKAAVKAESTDKVEEPKATAKKTAEKPKEEKPKAEAKKTAPKVEKKETKAKAAPKTEKKPAAGKETEKKAEAKTEKPAPNAEKKETKAKKEEDKSSEDNSKKDDK